MLETACDYVFDVHSNSIATVGINIFSFQELLYLVMWFLIFTLSLSSEYFFEQCTLPESCRAFQRMKLP